MFGSITTSLYIAIMAINMSVSAAPGSPPATQTTSLNVADISKAKFVPMTGSKASISSGGRLDDASFMVQVACVFQHVKGSPTKTQELYGGEALAGAAELCMPPQFSCDNVLHLCQCKDQRIKGHNFPISIYTTYVDTKSGQTGGDIVFARIYKYFTSITATAEPGVTVNCNRV